ncbi:MAG: PulJ/GspJ family protein, partial [Candidatus Xenobia bacterium]
TDRPIATPRSPSRAPTYFREPHPSQATWLVDSRNFCYGHEVGGPTLIRHGFTLLETVVASSLVALLVLFMATLLPMSAITMRKGRRISDATLLGSAELETLCSQIVHDPMLQLPLVPGSPPANSDSWTEKDETAMDGQIYHVQRLAQSEQPGTPGLYTVQVTVSSADQPVPVVLRSTVFDVKRYVAKETGS